MLYQLTHYFLTVHYFNGIFIWKMIDNQLQNYINATYVLIEFSGPPALIMYPLNLVCNIFKINNSCTLQSLSIYSCGTKYRGRGGDRCYLFFFLFFPNYLRWQYKDWLFIGNLCAVCSIKDITKLKVASLLITRMKRREMMGKVFFDHFFLLTHSTNL